MHRGCVKFVYYINGQFCARLYEMEVLSMRGKKRVIHVYLAITGQVPSPSHPDAVHGRHVNIT